jgi:hypothetical protein
MKSLTSLIGRVVAAGTIIGLPLQTALSSETNDLSAQTPILQPTIVVSAPAAATTSPQKLPYGVEDVLKLSRAQVSDDIVLNYIQNTGTIYNLGPQDIVYLRDQGVSDRVINGMIDQRKRVTELAAAQSAPAPAVPDAQSVPNATTVPVAPGYAQVAPQTTAPASTVYTIPAPSAGYYSYTYPYYGGYYYPYYGPSVYLGFGYGGYGHYHGYYHGGHYHGYSHGGGHHH